MFTGYFLDHTKNSNALFLSLAEARPDALESVLDTACEMQHTLTSYLQRIMETLFNLMAKNYVSKMNDSVHQG